jgi:hypothetical protein
MRASKRTVSFPSSRKEHPLKSATIPVSLLCLVLLTACPQNQEAPTPQQLVTDAAKAIEAVSIAADGAVKVVLTAMPDNTPERQQILDIIAKVVLADQHGAAIVRSLDGQTFSGGIQQVGTIVLPILTELRKTADDGLVGIKNPDSQAKAKTYIDAISVAINALQATWELYGVK